MKLNRAKVYRACEKELWIKAYGYDNYIVSSLGRVKNTKTNKFLVATTGKTGYPCLSLSKNGKVKRHSVHRLMMLSFCGYRPSHIHAAHINGKRDDCRLSNLRWSTISENHLDKRLHGTVTATKAKLTREQVHEIRNKFLRISQRKTNAIKLAKEFNVDRTAILRIARGATYGWLK